MKWPSLLVLLGACSEAPRDAPETVRGPPPGTVSRERRLDLEKQTPALTLPLLERGRRRYDVACAVCHGITGEADTLVANSFVGRHPPSLHEQRLRDKPDEQLFVVLGTGVGAMPPFPELSTEDRWAIVGYVRALQVSQRASLELAPPDVRSKLEAEVRR